MSRPNKSAAIRQAMADHPQARPSEIAKIVSDSGLAVTPQHVSMTKAAQFKKSSFAFDRWYTVQTINKNWAVCCSSEGISPIVVGPVQLAGKSYYQEALMMKARQNHHILEVRSMLRKQGIRGPEVFVTETGEQLIQVINRLQDNNPSICLNDLVSQILTEFGINEKYRDYMVGAIARAIEPEISEPVPAKKRPIKKLPNKGVNALIVTHNGTYYCFDMDEETWKKVLSCGEIESVISRLEQLGQQETGKKSSYGYVCKIDSTNFALPCQNIVPPLNMIDLRDRLRIYE